MGNAKTKRIGFILFCPTMSGGTGEIKLRFQEGRYRRLPLTACSHS
jgi:hypothetical protein